MAINNLYFGLTKKIPRKEQPNKTKILLDDKHSTTVKKTKTKTVVPSPPISKS